MRLSGRRPGLAGLLVAGASAVFEGLRAGGGRGAAQRLGRRALRRLATRLPRLGALAGITPAQTRDARTSAEPLGAAPSTLVVGAAAQLTSAPAWQDRVAAAEALAGTHDAQGVAALTQALSDPAEEVACAAAGALAGSPKPGATRALLAVLRDADGYYSPRVRARCVTALADRPLAPEQQQQLLELIADRDAEVSIAVIGAVAERCVAGASDSLLALLEEPSGYYLPVTRLAAARGLVRLRELPPERCKSLIAAERDPEVQGVLRGQLEVG